MKEIPSQLGTPWTIWPTLFSKLITYYFGPQILCHNKVNRLSAHKHFFLCTELGQMPSLYSWGDYPKTSYSPHKAPPHTPSTATTAPCSVGTLVSICPPDSSTFYLKTAPVLMPCCHVSVLALFHFPLSRSIVHVDSKQLKRLHHITFPLVFPVVQNTITHTTVMRLWM